MKPRVILAELVGISILMIGGVGSAVLAGEAIGAYGIALAFGLSLLVAVFVIGPVTGCHINPAVTIGMWAAGKTPARDVPSYLVGQFVGAIFGGALILGIANGKPGFDPENGFGSNGWGELSAGDYNLVAVAFGEIVFTAFFVLAVLATTRKGFPAGFAALAVGLMLTVAHLVMIPVDGTSVNPARSLGAAVFQRGEALEQLWAFLVFPTIGGLVAAAIWKYAMHSDTASQTEEMADA